MLREPPKRFFPEPLEFDWDEGNSYKNLEKHDVASFEAEEIFWTPELAPIGKQVAPQTRGEERFGALGVTKNGRCLFVSFTIRRGKIRVISARSMSKTERVLYEEICQKS